MRSKFRILLAFFILLIPTAAFSQISSVEKITEIPFSIDSGHIVVDLTIKKGVTAKVILSNLYPSSIEFSKFNDQKMVTNQQMFRNSVTDTFTPVAIMNGMKIGEMKIPSLKMYWDGTSDLNNKTFERLDGILGANFLQGKILQINFKDRTLAFLKKNPYKNLIDNNSSSDEIVVLKIKTSSQYPPKEVTFTTTEDVSINGRKVKSLISLNHNLALGLPDKTIAISDTAGKGKVDMKVGNLEYKNFQYYLPETSKNDKKYDVVLGSGFLAHFIVLLDLKNNWLILKKW